MCCFSGFRLGFNSLCAYASVNHLHFHAYYLENELLVEHCVSIDMVVIPHHPPLLFKILDPPLGEGHTGDSGLWFKPPNLVICTLGKCLIST